MGNSTRLKGDSQSILFLESSLISSLRFSSEPRSYIENFYFFCLITTHQMFKVSFFVALCKTSWSCSLMTPLKSSSENCYSRRLGVKTPAIALPLTLLFTLDGLAKKFGLTPEQFGENLRDSYQRHETEQFPAEPLELAKDYVCR